jgi:alkaline phosphatase
MNLTAGIKFFLLITILFVSAGFGQENPKYIFLFIGDGMAQADIMATESYVKDVQMRSGTSGERAKGLVLTTLPVKGKVTTFSKSSDITDSAASATAFSSGFKTGNGSLNIDSASGKRFEPMSRFAKRHGFKVGIISSSAPNHATPAGFYATNMSRNNYAEIAVEMAKSDIDYIGGPYVMGVSSDKDNIKELASDNGFKIVSTRRRFDELAPGTAKVWAYSPMPYILDAKHEISLADHTEKAIELLKDSKGFFMMIEGAQIDWASHANDGAAMIYEMIAFDEAVSKAVDFYHNNPDDTLIIVTSDHECGGLSLDMEKILKPGMSKIIEAQKGSRKASAEVFRQIERQKLAFDEALPIMQDFFGIESLTEQEMQTMRTAFNEGGEQRGDFSYGDNKKIALGWVRLVSERAGLMWSSLGHTSAAVPLYAMGAGEELFASNSDNALISWYIRSLISCPAHSLSGK